MCLCLYWPSGSGRDVGVPVHEALHCWGDVPTPPGLLPASPQQLLRLLWSVPAPRRLGRPWPQSLLHLLWGFSPDELLHLPGSAQVSRVRTNVVLALLRRILDRTGFWRKISAHSAVIHFLTSLLQASWLLADFCLPPCFILSSFVVEGIKSEAKSQPILWILS